MPLFDGIKTLRSRLLLAISVILCIGSGAIAEDMAWHISKSSGDVWMISSGAQQVALTNDASFKPGDEIRTGRNGRVLLVRGQESILVSPNSVISLPPAETEQKDGLSTIILQQAGSILLEVEKRAVKHFEVETPYLAAVVKGTQFRVSVNKDDSSVDVLRGEVEGRGLQVRPAYDGSAGTGGKGGDRGSGRPIVKWFRHLEPDPAGRTSSIIDYSHTGAPRGPFGSGQRPEWTAGSCRAAARRNWIERRAIGRARRFAPACLGHFEPHPAKPVPSVIGGPATWA